MAAKGLRPRPRIVFLYSEPSPYIVACWKELRAQYDAQLLFVHWEVNPEAPFDLDFPTLGKSIARKGLSKKDIEKHVMDFEPDGIFISGWLDRDYLSVAATAKKNGIPVIMGLDTQWSGSIKQWFGCLTARWWLRRSVTAIWTPGERQAVLAGHLGYRGANCWYGLYCCDFDSYREAGLSEEQRLESFLYVGRYVEDKGLPDLLEAYALYRQRDAAAWPLYCVGTGKLKPMLEGRIGVHDLGFVEPEQLPDVMGYYGGVFILPSVHEPWGVALQEAAAAGCPLICTDAVGAGVHLLQHGLNGLGVGVHNPDQLAAAMTRLSNASRNRRGQMGAASVALASQFTPRRWAQTIVEGIARSGETPFNHSPT
jgi:glycosyltransferase involved in cell wall biosynthesis